MSAISAETVKVLRAQTGAGMMDCKRALAACEGDMESSIDWLRQKGHARMAKKADRLAQEGLVALAVQSHRGALIELSSETDFVARHKAFDEAACVLVDLALEKNIKDKEELLSTQMGSTKMRVADYIQDLAVQLSENISLKRAVVLASKPTGIVGSYLHSKQGKQTGKIGVLACFSKGDQELAHQIAMHISALRPLAISKEDIEPELIKRERDILFKQAQEEGKPEKIISQMVEGRLDKFYSQVALLEQEFIFDEDQTIDQLLEKHGAKLDRFSYFVLGEG